MRLPDLNMDKQGHLGGSEKATNMADSLVHSPLSSHSESWVTFSDLTHTGLHPTPNSFIQTAEFLLENPNINSSHVLRADILFDSLGALKTPEEKERGFASDVDASGVLEPKATVNVETLPARDFPSFKLKRTVVRRFIPRNAQLDRSLDQTCHFYESSGTSSEIPEIGADGPEKENHSNTQRQDRYLVTYSPHYSSQEDVPYYHPSMESLALLYCFDRNPFESLSTSEAPQGAGTLSVHFLPFPQNPPKAISNRLRRSLSFILSTYLRLSLRSTSLALNGGNDHGAIRNPFKDNLIPQHIVQNTYTRLKMTYSADLIRNWVEKTEPSKHVFEDLAITAFLIELWRGMYGVKPLPERDLDEKRDQKYNPSFPGFVDFACGNGLLVHILLMEGYWGQGFDARRRKTWSTFPESTQGQLKEGLCIPRPFKDSMNNIEDIIHPGTETLSGIFNSETFIISNHADELTAWTPLLATLSNPNSPLPFLAIPCCSHSLSGIRYHFPPPQPNTEINSPSHQKPNKANDEATPQPSSGDLKALRTSKIQAQTDYNSQSHHSSTYGCLTAKVMAVAEEIGIEVEKTKLRIPSTRNIGIVGGRDRRKNVSALETDVDHDEAKSAATLEKVHSIIERECRRDGGVEAAANVWATRILSLHMGPGRGKVNWGRKIQHDPEYEHIHVD